ncbi:winged helix-turn-helix domain-containing protein/riboflavin kinase [Methanolapillus ohkumae]|uniref:Riboflavin kinase n=1 Tax=Methanolapillus ohkumae TaxID=3028298 RepID=A0AA96V7U8_9EURY|nr:hypothetical protein MsAm2_12270 [Methanosarcinaceae archaeon Am2]
MDQIRYLKMLALLGCGKKSVKISVKDLENELQTSDKTISRNLKILEDDGLIGREITGTGQNIMIRPGGLKLLELEFADYKKIFDAVQTIDIDGTIVSGVGEGKYYISIDGYRKQFEEKLCFQPYPGTLNVRVREYCLPHRKKLKEMPSVKINGFSDGGRTFGEGYCYPSEIRGVSCAIIVPERTHYQEDLLEIIAPVNLRETLDLKDGDDVSVFVGKSACP